MFVNYPIKFVIEDKDITSMDRVQVEVLKMMNKCTFREIRLVSNFHLRGYNFFPSYFNYRQKIEQSDHLLYIQHDTITTTYISFIITVDKNITYIGEVPRIFVGLSIVAIKE